MPLVDVAGSAGTTLPEQIAKAVPKLNTGVTFGITVTTKFVVAAHCPTAGVNV